MLIATGKNVRKALITATGIHTGQALAAEPDHDHRCDREDRDGLRADDVGQEAAAHQVGEMEDDADRDADDRADREIRRQPRAP